MRHGWMDGWMDGGSSFVTDTPFEDPPEYATYLRARVPELHLEHGRQRADPTLW